MRHPTYSAALTVARLITSRCVAAVCFAAVCFASACFAGDIPAQGLPAQISGGGSPSFVPNEYQTQTVFTLKDFPASIQDAATRHLRARLGDAYFARLIFDLGQIATLKPGKQAPGAPMFSYRLAFHISDPEKGIARYTGDLWLDAEGRIMREIQIPAVGTAPGKAVFAPLSCTASVAASLSLSPTAVDLTYDAKSDSIVYVLRQETQGAQENLPSGSSGCVLNRRTAIISAHTCELLHSDSGYTRLYYCPPPKK